MKDCPSCERKFKGIEDFPRVYVVGFEKAEFPEGVGGSMKHLYYPKKQFEDQSISTIDEIPKEVLNLFRETGKDLIVYEGKVWERTTSYGAEYQSSDDIASDVRKSFENPELQRYLDSLGEFVGSEVKTTDIFPNWERSERFGVYYFRKRSGLEKEGDDLVFHERDTSGGHSVAFHEKEENSNYRSSNIDLMGDGPNLGRGGGQTLSTLMNLGTLTYEGRINSPQLTE